MAEPDSRPQITIEDLIRWEDNGAAWRTVELTDERAVLELCTCYGEPVDTVRSDAPELIEFVRSRRGQHP
jgi:hypothetical protein